MEQTLTPEAYTSETWFDREQKRLFSKCWSFFALASDFNETGDFVTGTVAGNPLAVVQDGNGALRAFHNLCRHRGTELLEGKGNAGKTLVCPYHRWTYGLDGALRGVPNRTECFADLDRGSLGLKTANVGEWKGLVFVNPDPDAIFEDWIGPLRDVAFPHDLSDPKLNMSDTFVYKMNCNWKVFYENAIDGYHLAYLHENTLGGPLPALNEWVQHGDNLVWYSTERDGIRHRIPKFVQDQADQARLPKIKGAEDPGYGGVYMLFPTTILAPSPWSFTLSTMEPVSAGVTLLRARTWSLKSWFGYSESPSQAEGYDTKSGIIESRFWTKHPLETGDFQTEDIWVCEKMQRSLQAPHYSVGALAKGSGGEEMLPVFQKQVLKYMSDV